MIRFIYINGILMPSPPSDAVCSHGGEGEVIRLSDGGHHVIPSESEPLCLSVTFPLYADRCTYADSVIGDIDDAVSFLTDAIEAPFEILLLGKSEGGDVFDINMTAVATDLAFTYKKDKTDVTLKLREYITEAVS